MQVHPDLKIQSNKTSQLNQLLEEIKNGTAFNELVGSMRTYEKSIDEVKKSALDTVLVGQISSSAAQAFSSTFSGDQTYLITDKGVLGTEVSKAWAKYLGIPYILGCPMPIQKSTGADCGSSCQQVLNDLGVSWNSRYVPYMMEEAQKQNLWISGDDYFPTCGDMIVVCGDNHIIMSDGGSGDWDAGCSSGVVHRSSWRAAFPGGATGYIKSSILIAEKLNILGEAGD